jgi:hypothetical protein
VSDEGWLDVRNSGSGMPGKGYGLALVTASLLAMGVHLGLFGLAVWVFDTSGAPAWFVAMAFVGFETAFLLGLARLWTWKRGVPSWFWYGFGLVLGMLALMSGTCIGSLFEV